MARVPTVPTVQPNISLPAFQRPDRSLSRSVEQNALSVRSQGQEAVNKSVQQFGQDLAVNIARIEKERDVSRAHEALYQFSEQARVKYDELRQRKGGNAIGSREEFRTWYDDNIKRTVKDLRPGLQTDLFRSKAMVRRESDLDAMSRHEASEHSRYKVSQAKSALDSAVKDAALYSDDPERIDGIIRDAHQWIDVANPGLDNSAAKSENDFKIRSAALSYLLRADPDKAKALFQRWEGVMGPAADVLRNDIDKEWLYKQAKIAAPGQYDKQFDFAMAAPGIDGDVKRAVIGRISTDQAEYESRERDARANHKVVTDENDYAAWQEVYAGTMTTTKLDDLASKRRISLSAYRAIQAKLRNPTEANNPRVVGEIADAISNGVDAKTLLDQALADGNIKTETYISMVGKLSSREYKDGLTYLENALKPNIADRYNPDIHRRHADAVLRFNNLVEQGTDPVDAATDVVQSYLGDVGRTINGLPSPRYLKGQNKSDLNALFDAMTDTAAAFSRGELSTDDYNYEMNNIKELIEIVGRTQSASSATERR